MADLAFTVLSPWAATGRTGRFGRTEGAAGLDIVESGRCATALLSARRGRGADLARAAGDLGLELPTTPSWTQERGFVVLWIAPGQWLIRGPGTFEDLAAALAPLTPFAAMIDQTDTRGVLTLAGPAVREVLAKGVEIDLHPRAFKPGDVAVTLVAGISAVLWQLDDRPSYEVAVPRSLAGSFWHWLTDSAAEYGYAVDAA